MRQRPPYGSVDDGREHRRTQCNPSLTSLLGSHLVWRISLIVDESVDAFVTNQGLIWR